MARPSKRTTVADRPEASAAQNALADISEAPDAHTLDENTRAAALAAEEARVAAENARNALANSGEQVLVPPPTGAQFQTLTNQVNNMSQLLSEFMERWEGDRRRRRTRTPDRSRQKARSPSHSQTRQAEHSTTPERSRRSKRSPPRRRSRDQSPQPSRPSSRNRVKENPRSISRSDVSYRRKSRPDKDRYKERMDELNKKLETIIRDKKIEEGLSLPSPLSKEIVLAPIPARFKMPHIETYDGTKDPIDHLQRFHILMLLQDASDAMMCKAFSVTLTESARLWYSQLCSGSITSFEHLSRQFVNHFISSKRHLKTSSSLMAIKQGKDESLRDYISRFNQEALLVKDLNQNTAQNALQSGLKPSKFKFALLKKSPKTFSDILNKADRYINAEETMVAEAEGNKIEGKRKEGDEPSTDSDSREQP